MKILVVMTAKATLHLLDGEQHPSGFWAEEFVVPHELFRAAGHTVDVATIGGVAPTVDPTSIDPQFLQWVRPAGSPNEDAANAAEYVRVIEATDQLRHPLALESLGEKDIAQYDGVYVSGGHGAIGDLPKSDELAQILRWVIAQDKPLATVCHGHTALLALRDGEGRWPFEGYLMTAFSHSEELVTNMAGRLPLILEVELTRLGARYEKAEAIWDSHVVVDRGLTTGQNPYSSKALAETFLQQLAKG
ncbi:type 1 glutamine amidotransferase domain-containing protein [Streptomyces sp. NBC_00513]|uniref:type 1 glutamine amidotransferase domain-containing protein n=1 Tax=unclassified Streptomyces TaxID=2593676 RepID=UPI00224E5B62|nr:type 1 glutamine amidotransferase domain-containing protein [Streptomyces sp. NBC_00424]MCX5076491.1 type 1 glutamine amidotransferase domain-containing protein [Streptomyces sp. NBC_00424]WUD40477.1 type 1 glutamine amidotransferase domain-containing protein [Streptomyces sp. NBC_00513]